MNRGQRKWNGCWGRTMQLNICGDFSLIFSNERRKRKTSKRLQDIAEWGTVWQELSYQGNKPIKYTTVIEIWNRRRKGTHLASVTLELELGRQSINGRRWLDKEKGLFRDTLDAREPLPSSSCPDSVGISCGRASSGSSSLRSEPLTHHRELCLCYDSRHVPVTLPSCKVTRSFQLRNCICGSEEVRSHTEHNELQWTQGWE